jgi:DNA-binding transcriptional LysR family regulator
MRNSDRIRNTSGMLVFSQVLEEGSFSGAARKLGRSKSSVSREVSALERRLGAQLLRRTTRRMSLTEVGEVFLEGCKRVVEEAESTEHSVGQLQHDPSGEIRIAAPMSFGHLQLAPRLGRFLGRYPNIRVDVDLTDRRVDLVHERFDLSVRISQPREQSYVIRRLANIHALVCASPGYLAAHGKPEQPSDLKNHNCLGYTSSPEVWPFAGGVKVRARGTLNADNGDALRQAALADVGIVYLPTFLLGDDLRAGRLMPVLEQHMNLEHSTTGLYAVYPGSRHLSPKVRAMIDWLIEDLGPNPDWDRELPLQWT